MNNNAILSQFVQHQLATDIKNTCLRWCIELKMQDRKKCCVNVFNESDGFMKKIELSFVTTEIFAKRKHFDFEWANKTESAVFHLFFSSYCKWLISPRKYSGYAMHTSVSYTWKRQFRLIFLFLSCGFMAFDFY